MSRHVFIDIYRKVAGGLNIDRIPIVQFSYSFIFFFMQNIKLTIFTLTSLNFQTFFCSYFVWFPNRNIFRNYLGFPHYKIIDTSRNMN